MSNPIFLSLVCSFFSLRLFAQVPDCAKSPNNNAKAECFGQKLHAAEAEMDQALKRAITDCSPAAEKEKKLPVLPDDEQRFIEKQARLTVIAIKASQTKWLSYRESACSIFEHRYAGGNIAAAVVPACKLEMTQQRTRWLQDLVQREVGIKKGAE